MNIHNFREINSSFTNTVSLHFADIPNAFIFVQILELGGIDITSMKTVYNQNLQLSQISVTWKILVSIPMNVKRNKFLKKNGNKNTIIKIL